jgi:hypothetical protein
MNRDGWDLEGLSPEERELARLLEERAQLMREIDRAAAEIDPGYARTLRAHLLHGEELAPHPTFARQLRARLTGRTGRYRARQPIRRFLPWIGALLLSAVFVVVALFAGLRGTSSRSPYPTRSDLLFNLPSPAIVIRHILPTLSLIHPAPARPYPGPVTLRARTLPTGPSTLKSYRLSAPTGAAARGRQLLLIHAPVRQVRIGDTSWLVAADGGTDRRPLHSLAVSISTGELIYHDRRNFLLPRARHPAPRVLAVAAARHWLTRLGWPGESMPLKRFGPTPSLPRVWQIVFGWTGVTDASIEEATLWVAPDRSIVEAWVWPPVAGSNVIAARPVAAAWSDLVSGKVPLAIPGAPPGTKAHATATLRRVGATLVLVPGKDGAAYLVPAYRFSGRARLGRAAQARSWISLSPGARR